MSAEVVTGARNHRGESEWRRLVAEHERSGLSQRAFCNREGLCVQSLTNWRRRLGELAAPVSNTVAVRGDEATAPAFVETDSALPRPLDCGVRVRLELDAGIVLELSRETDGHTAAGNACIYARCLRTCARASAD